MLAFGPLITFPKGLIDYLTFRNTQATFPTFRDILKGNEHPNTGINPDVWAFKENYIEPWSTMFGRAFGIIPLAKIKKENRERGVSNLWLKDSV
jgi:hypothetical protein